MYNQVSTMYNVLTLYMYMWTLGTMFILLLHLSRLAVYVPIFIQFQFELPDIEKLRTEI